MIRVYVYLEELHGVPYVRVMNRKKETNKTTNNYK